jgi:hypothetical protein
MDDLVAAVHRLVERQAVEDTLLRYASAIDTKDYATLRSLFCDDVRGQYGDVVVEGADELLRWIDGMTVDRSWQHHLLSVYHVDFVSDAEACALTYHTSHQTNAATPDRCTKIVARYRDTVRKVEGGWKIAEKVMEIGWMEETERQPVATS